MLLLRLILTVILTISVATADLYLQDKPYRFDILNKTMTVEKNPISIKDLISEIEKTTGYKVVDKANLPLKKRLIDLDCKKVGDYLVAILLTSDRHLVYSVQDEKRRITIEYGELLSIELPSQWDSSELLSYVENNFPAVTVDSLNNRIYFLGSSEDIQKLKKIVKPYEEHANSSIPLVVKIYPYCSSSKDLYFIGYRKVEGSEEFKPVQVKAIKVRHGDRIYIDNDKYILVDIQKSRFVFRDKVIPFDYMSSLAVVVRKDLINSAGSPSAEHLKTGVSFFMNIFKDSDRSKQCDFYSVVLEKSLIGKELLF